MRSVRPQTVTLAVLAILFGLAAAITFKSFLMVQRPVIQPPPEAPPDTVQVLVWQSNLPVNARVRDTDFSIKMQDRAKVKTIQQPVQYLEQVRGRVCKVSVSAGNVVKLSEFYDLQKEKLPTWVDVLPHDNRLISLRIDDPTFSPSMLQPNSYIDVSLTIDRSDNGIRTTTRLVHGIQVVAPPVSDEGIPNIVTTSKDGKVSITVSVTSEEAAKLTQAQQSGGLISVSLCPGPPAPTDLAVNDVDTNNLLHISPPVQPRAQEPPIVNVVEVFRGTQVSYSVFDGETGDSVNRADAETAAQNAAAAAIAARRAAAAGTPTPAVPNGGKPRCLKCEEEARKKALKASGNLPPEPVPETLPPTPAPTSPLPTPAGSPIQ